MGVPFAIRTLGELGQELVLAPERYLAGLGSGAGLSLAELVTERREHIDPHEFHGTIVCDTSHAKDGVLDLAAALRADGPAKSAKKRARVGDVIVSRLRPYLRQVAFVHPEPFALLETSSSEPFVRDAIAVSTEFHVFAPKDVGDDLAFLVPFLLARDTQARLAAAQEGGHHPRIPRASMMELRVPHEIIADRDRVSALVRRALRAFYRADARLRSVLSG